MSKHIGAHFLSSDGSALKPADEKSQNSGAAEKNSSNANGKSKMQKQYPGTVSVFVGKIPRDATVKELKKILLPKVLNPSIF